MRYLLVLELMLGCWFRAVAGSSTPSSPPSSSSSSTSSLEIQSYNQKQLSLLSVRNSLLLDAITQYGLEDSVLSSSPASPPRSRHRSKFRRSNRLPSSVVSNKLGSVFNSHISSMAPLNPPMRKQVKWDVDISTDEKPLSCLYSFDAEVGRKVICPHDVDNDNDSSNDSSNTRPWITLSSLNRLRRNDLRKVNPMWHDKYDVANSWFASGKYSITGYASPSYVNLVTYLLDSPVLIKLGIMVAIFLAGLAGFPVICAVANFVFRSQVFWTQYNVWARVAYAPLPLKLLIAQVSYRFLSDKIGALTNIVRDQLVEVESEGLERGVPVTNGRGVIIDSREGGGVDSESESESKSDP